MPAIALLGATGRMGRAIVRAAGERSDVTITGATGSAGGRHTGEDVGTLANLPALGVRVTSDLAAALQGSDVAVDFSLPAGIERRAHEIAERRCGWVIGTTGLTQAQLLAVDEASKRVPVLASPNMSLAVQLLLRLVAQAAHALPANFDIEIHEAHHRDKLDAPSGTARRLGEVAATARGVKPPQGELLRATASSVRAPGSIGFSVARGGDIVGEHRVVFAGPGEQLVLEHRATDRMAFARGALTAAVWLTGRAAGRYDMSDVISWKQ